MNVRVRAGLRWSFVVGLGWAVVASSAAQTGRPAIPVQPQVFGAVTGHITCVDTNQPARLASVTLQTIDVPNPSAEDKAPIAVLQTFQTGLDGAFMIRRVRPGTYYVVIQHPGYVSPISRLSRAELHQPTAELLAGILKVVPTVTVEANHTSTIDVRIERGAEFSGTVRYDDGTPVAGAYVAPLVREAKGAGASVWMPKVGGARTDDIGHYRITGLSAGEYLLSVDLQMQEIFTSSVLGGNYSEASNTKYSLSFYSGDTARKDKGSPMKVEASEARNGADLTIPLSKLHAVSGSLTEKASGHVINSGRVALNFEDGTELASTKVDKEDAGFRFDFVPEGTYTLVVTEAADVVRTEISNGPGNLPPTHTESKVVKSYGGQQQPLAVQNDVSGVVVALPEKAGKQTGVQ